MKRRENKTTVFEKLLFVIGFAVVVMLFGIVGYIENHYTMECSVVKVTDDEVILEDTAGYRWAIDNNGQYNISETYTVTFDTHTTDNRLDDEIVKIQ